MQSKKKIARIYSEAKIFLTIYGTYYSYDFAGGKVVCRRLTEGQQELLARIYGSAEDKENLVRWEPVASGCSSCTGKILGRCASERECIC